jgi:acyl-CoA synthetase (AMP-forming)/AMP-acid ligase II
MIFESTYTPLHLPSDSATFLDLVLDYPASHRTLEPLLFPPPGLASNTKLRPISLNDVRTKALKLAHSLVDGLFDQRSLQAGERVMMLSTNRHDYIASIIGVCLAGGVAVLCDSDASANTLANQIEATNAKYIIASSGGFPMEASSGSTGVNIIDRGESCLIQAEKAIALLKRREIDTLSCVEDRQVDERVIIVINESREIILESTYGRGKESEELKSRRKDLKGHDLAVVCFR